MQKIDFTIIIPHYNIPNLLLRCLNSIPDRLDIQVIVVDDCSPCQKEIFEMMDKLHRSNLEYYSTPKGGSAGRARNVGLYHAHGTWIILMDADDLFVDDMGEILADAKNREEDMLFYNYLSVYSDDLSKPASRNLYHPYFEQFKKDEDESNFRYRFHSFWGKIIKRNLIEKYDIRCDPSRCSDDVKLSVKCGVHAGEIAIIDRPFFIITERQGSLEFSNSGPKPIWEYEVRILIAFECQAYVDSIKKGIDCRQYISESLGYFHHYKKDFMKFYLKMLPKYPKLCMNIVKVWVLSKFDKKLLNNYK